MGKVCDITPRKRAKIEILIKEVYRGSEIAQKVGVNKPSVTRIRKRLKAGEGVSTRRSGKCGHGWCSGRFQWREYHPVFWTASAVCQKATRRGDEEWLHRPACQTPNSSDDLECHACFRCVMSVIVQGHMNQQQYKAVLERRLLSQISDWVQLKGFTGTGDFVFMHDSAPCHKDRVVTRFLEEHGIVTW